MTEQNANHIVFEVCFENYPEELENVEYWENIGSAALKEGNFTIHHQKFHKFKPHGVSGFWLLSESHLSFHTWPEQKHVFVDLFCCAHPERTQKAAELLYGEFEKMGGKVVNENVLKRGFIFEKK